MAFSTQVIVVLIRTLIPRATNWQHVTFIATNAYVYDYTYHIIFTVHICTRNYEKTFQNFRKNFPKTFQKLSNKEESVQKVCRRYAVQKPYSALLLAPIWYSSN